MFSACEKNDSSADYSNLTLEAAVTQFDESGFTINYTAGDACDRIEYAVVASVDAKEAYEQFEQGSLEGRRRTQGSASDNGGTVEGCAAEVISFTDLQYFKTGLQRPVLFCTGG